MKSAAVTLLLLLLPVAVSSQIIYTDISPDTLIADNNTAPGQYELDLDSDGGIDYFFMHFFLPVPVYVLSIYTEYHTSHEILVNGNSKVIAHDRLAPIADASGDWICTVDGNNSSGMSFASEWMGNGDRYIGLRLFHDGGWYYGWLRAAVAEDASGIILKEYAVQTQPDTPIMAGDPGTINIDQATDPMHYHIKIHDRFITVTLDMPRMLNASVYDIMGTRKSSAANNVHT